MTPADGQLAHLYRAIGATGHAERLARELDALKSR